ncbi:MAG: hypothetical protein RQ752_07980 [Thermohalobaculum sp.]|nr:hypothetical protein [Thermohalobaculum sp.]
MSGIERAADRGGVYDARLLGASRLQGGVVRDDAMRPGPASPRLRDVGLASLAAMLALAVAVPENFLDPFASFDDFPILFDWWRLYFGKTLSEGRWVNFAWQYLVGPVDRFAAFYLVASGWAVICAIIAASMFRGDARPWRAMILAVALAMSAPFSALTLWSNTLVPIMAVLLAYTAIAAWAPARAAVALFLVFAPLGVMSYTTSPMIMALALALCQDWRGLRRAAGLVGLVVAGVGLGVLVIYALNWHAHGVFGIVADSWRFAPPPADAATAAVETAAAGQAPAGLDGWGRLVVLSFAAFLASPLFAYAVSPARVLPILGVLCCGFGFLMLTHLMTDARIPLRSMPFVWTAFVAFLALMARDTPRRAVGVAMLGALAVASVVGASRWRALDDKMAPFQRMTVELVAGFPVADPQDAPILIYGAPSKIDTIREVHTDDRPRDWTLAFRLHALTGRQACLCDRPWDRLGDHGYCEAETRRALCEASAAVAEGLTPPAGGPAVATGAGGVTVVRFPE